MLCGDQKRWHTAIFFKPTLCLGERRGDEVFLFSGIVLQRFALFQAVQLDIVLDVCFGV